MILSAKRASFERKTLGCDSKRYLTNPMPVITKLTLPLGVLLALLLGSLRAIFQRKGWVAFVGVDILTGTLFPFDPARAIIGEHGRV